MSLAVRFGAISGARLSGFIGHGADGHPSLRPV